MLVPTRGRRCTRHLSSRIDGLSTVSTEDDVAASQPTSPAVGRDGDDLSSAGFRSSCATASPAGSRLGWSFLMGWSFLSGV